MSINSLEIIRVEPPLGSNNHVFMHEKFFTNVWLKTSFPMQLIRPQLWTNAVHKLNPDGKWHAIDFHFLKKDLETEELHYQVDFTTISVGEYEYTLRVGIVKMFNGSQSYSHFPKQSPHHKRSHSNNQDHQIINNEHDIVEWKWAGTFGQNGKIHVSPPNENMPWTKGPQAIEIAPNVYIGNFIAASQEGEQLKFNAVLNLAAECDLSHHPKLKYKKIPIGDGAHHIIDDKIVEESIIWIRERLREGCKVLIMCRAGIGRSGSIGIAYLYSSHPDWTYKQTLDYIWSIKSDIYPHKGLQSSLEKLYPRIKKSQSTTSLQAIYKH